ncbi:translation initiation factor IF-2 [Alteribacillus iranensis]|uniref:Translation initiation factor IF-2 n=1 Tax=Alteribacillus iranensis TaxID=930128 RepID=A0A1I2A396_9BACI|nr:translation initiation factor IF-2 [Alteribacillus iranensis]SFE38247.1 bacterial translation initiation factor 2 (bIF-2) [Alteribacillus iranensis]
MKKMRVYEYAKSVNKSSKDIVEQLKKMNINVSNHMSVIDERTIAKLEGKSDSKGKEESTASAPKKEKNSGGGNQKREDNQNKAMNKTNKDKKTNNQNKKQDKRGKNQKGPKKDQRKRSFQEQKPAPTPDKITYSGTLTVGDLAEKLNKDSSEIIKKLMFLGVMATKNEDLEKETIELIAEDYGVEVEEEVFVDELGIETQVEEDDPDQLEERPPVVTIMGHVDHGKTTLLDAIRHTKVTEGEAGGITQHIGAYQVTENDKKLTFLDTPGHAAFTTMRARGAQVTDITVLVVAADDGVMPQTKEAINHAKAAEVPIIVAVNKMDKESANPDRVMQELTEFELVPEAWGGDTIFVNVSALNGEGIDELLEMLLLVAEVEELKANPNKRARGTVVEAELDKGRGPVATLLVQEGTMNVGDPIVVGNMHGKIRAMVNDIGRRVKSAGPSTPVEITGLNGVPQAGDQFVTFEDEKKARQFGEARASRAREEERSQTSKVSIDDLFSQIQEGDVKEINVIVKADVQGSVEAVRGSLEKIEVEGVKINIIHAGAGAITESDVILASASNALIIGFNVRPDVNAKRTAESEKVDIRLHRVIYDAIEEIESAMKGMLDPEYEEKVIGQVEVRQLFKVSRIGTIAGSYVLEGKITRDSTARLIREGVVVYEGKINALKRFKDDVREVSSGYECGITLENFNDIKEGDIIEAYVMEEIKRA